MRKLMIRFGCLAAVVVLNVAGANADDGPLIRHAADFFEFDGTEFETSTSATGGVGSDFDGAQFYKRLVKLPPSSNVLYVTLYATGDEHGGAGLLLSCRVSFGSSTVDFCRPSTAESAPAGWVTVHKVPSVVGKTNNNCNDGGGGPGDCHDNVIAYSWCVQIPPETTRASVRLRMATSIEGEDVFIEKGQVYIDSSFVEQTGGCSDTAATASSKDGKMAKTTRQQR